MQLIIFQKTLPRLPSTVLLTNKEKNLQDKNLQEFTRTSKRFIKTPSLLVPIYLTLPYRLKQFVYNVCKFQFWKRYVSAGKIVKIVQLHLYRQPRGDPVNHMFELRVKPTGQIWSGHNRYTGCNWYHTKRKGTILFETWIFRNEVTKWKLILKSR